MLSERELLTLSEASNLQPAPTTPLLVLSESEFAKAVRNAFRNFNNPDVLASNPLHRSRLLHNDNAPPTPASLQALLRNAAEDFRNHPREQRLYRALDATCFRPAQTQELAAERLDLPFSTYRYHLTTAIERITTRLWQQEVLGPDQP